MSWWTWAVVGYFGLSVALLAVLLTVCGAVELRTRLRGRRLVVGAERFIADVTPPVVSSSTAR